MIHTKCFHMQLTQWYDQGQRLWHLLSSVNSFFKRACAAIQWGIVIWVLVGPFVCSHTSCVRTAKASGWAFAGRLCDKYHKLMNLLKWCFIPCLVSFQRQNVVLLLHVYYVSRACPRAKFRSHLQNFLNDPSISPSRRNMQLYTAMSSNPVEWLVDGLTASDNISINIATVRCSLRRTQRFSSSRDSKHKTNINEPRQANLCLPAFRHDKV